MEKIFIPVQIINSLKNNPVQNCNILNFIEDNPVTGIDTAGSSVLIKGISDREWIYISSNNESELNELICRLPEGNLNFAVIEDWQIPVIEKRYHVQIELTTIKFFLPEEIEAAPVFNSKLIALSNENAEYIYINNIYKEFTAIDYINERITKGISCGLIEDGRLTAWAITHDDGAIGFLHVLDEYRRRGYAKDIMYYMINKVREKGRIPFAQIEENNFISIGLVKSLGFKEYKRVHWLNTKTILFDQ